jgi:hypothetical protein
MRNICRSSSGGEGRGEQAVYRRAGIYQKELSGAQCISLLKNAKIQGNYRRLL